MQIAVTTDNGSAVKAVNLLNSNAKTGLKSLKEQ